ncbi:uncharacterized protein CLUP02_02428 [Colletotrichum lupini]|uniref:Uncharacterized protein n=1 Tax=Colletotrichum lupini TaxID=145971 RepID=A0A9Q8SGH2_9PEZI|nr:uncharacterized protein CLUP02_02428 [Colletotrichum lupini]UQC76962.1 hypothetical protein CLUP02_02428 [Colletotrichum lupini]
MAFRSVLHDSIPSTAPFDTDPSFQATNGPCTGRHTRGGETRQRTTVSLRDASFCAVRSL